jgi:hypothetical protein
MDNTSYDELHAICAPHYDDPIMQTIKVEVRREDTVVATLKALRIAIHCYDPISDADHVINLFDMHCENSYGLSEALKKRRKAIAEIVPGEISMGLIGILEIDVNATVRGDRLSHKLIKYLRELHAGMGWHVALQAVPMEFKERPDKVFRDMRARLIRHYAEIGFEQVSPRGSPELMATFWDGETS